MELIDGRPFVSIPHAATICGIDSEDLRSWLFDPEMYSVKFVKIRRKKELYADTESVLLTVKAKCQHRVYELLRRNITRNGGRRTLTAAQKQQVAAEQQWKCGHCERLLRTYEVDHCEEWCLRANDSRSNIIALCPPCHRLKTQEAQRRADALFEERIPPKFDESGAQLFSKYFCNEA